MTASLKFDSERPRLKFQFDDPTQIRYCFDSLITSNEKEIFARTKSRGGGKGVC